MSKQAVAILQWSRVHTKMCSSRRYYTQKTYNW